MTEQEEQIYIQIIASGISVDPTSKQMGARCVAPRVRSFFEDKMFKLS